ncbi:AcrR family transcriptional regulator [Conexibacter arvalis]|uniref:AcrR family transcriptional regulator n=2 Tax=Conexibacter arvalis TaxID=912552 RepID=A0A840IAT0_9ACTN|nr:AcrR family transcriptional regulator [Conexibacter arvalis]
MAPAPNDAFADGLEPPDFALVAKRERLFAAFVAEVGERGYADTAVAHVLRRAGMSRKTFYELFENREDCFLQAYDAALLRARMLVGAAYHEGGRWRSLRERVESGLRAFLNCCAAEPAFARMCVVEVLAAGPRARERRDAAILEFARFIEFPREEARGDSAPSLVSEAIAGGIYGILYSRIARGETEQLPELLGELMDAGLGQLVDRDEEE